MSDNPNSRLDGLVKVTAAGGRIRALAAYTTGIAETARLGHQTAPLATAALGKALTGGLLLANALMKEEGRLTIRIVGGGPIGGIIVDAGADGSVRGYVGRPDLYLSQGDKDIVDIGLAVGREGFLYVTHDRGTGHPYTGVVQLVSGELGEDFTHYLATSEQIPAAVSLGIFINRDGTVASAGGLLVQLLPDAGDEIAWRLEQTIKSLPGFSELMNRCATPEDVVRQALEGFQVDAISHHPVGFRCHCSQEKVMAAIASLGEQEIRSMIQEDGKAEVRCHFCGHQYHVSRAELNALIEAS